MRGGDCGDGVVIGRQAEKIDGNNRTRLQAGALCGRHGLLAAGRVEIERVGADVGKDRRRTGKRNDFRRRAEGEGRTDDRIAGSDAPSHQHQHATHRCRSSRRSRDARRKTPPVPSPSARTSGPLMNWQCASTRPTASSTARPRRRRWAATSINGMGRSSRRAWEFITGSNSESENQPATRRGPLRCGALDAAGTLIEAANGNFKTCHALLAGHGRRPAGTDCVDEGQQFGPQRLGITDRQMPHRIAAVRLEAETFGDLQSQQISDQIFIAGGDMDRCAP